MKCRCVTRQRRTRPRMAAKVKRILVALGFVLVLETIPAISTLVLLLLFVCTNYRVRIHLQGYLGEGRKYLSSSWVSNFLGFLGQHSQMKTPCILGPPPCFEWAVGSECFREVMSGLESDIARPWCVLEIEPRGLGFRDRDVT